MSTALPRPPRLVGREAAVAALAEALAPGSVTAVVGLPGVGKSALVAAVAAGWGDVVWVDVAQASAPRDLWAALGAALGVTLERPEDGHPRVTGALGERPAPLVVLDAAERLDAAAWEQVARLDRDVPRAAWAVTTVVRPPVAVRVLELAPLDADAAVTLLVGRARERALDQPPHPDDPVWRALAARLDGLPLALELAAGRFGVLTAGQILERLDRPGLLVGGRHGTLSGALQYAWSLLGEADRAALAACCVFRGGFDVAAAEAVLGDDALDRLTTLRERSALAWRDGRFYVLDGLRRLAETEGAAVLAEATARHRAYFARHGMALRTAALGPAPAAASAALLREQANFLAAFRSARPADPVPAAELALALLRSLWMYGPLWRMDELGDLSALAREVDAALGAGLLITAGSLEVTRGNLDRAEPLLDLALERATAAESPKLLCWSLAERADAHTARGQTAAASALLRRAVEVAPVPYARASTLNKLGHLERRAGRHEAAAEVYLEGIALMDGLRSVRGQAGLRCNLAVVRCEQRRYAEARALYEAVIALAEGTASIAFEAHANYAELAVLQGDLALAEAQMAHCRGVERGTEADGELGIGEAVLRWAAGDRDGARTALTDAIARTGPRDPERCVRARAWLAALEPGPASGDAIAAARAAGCHAELVDVLEAAILGVPLPPAPAAEPLDAQIARVLLARHAAPTWKVDGDGRWFERPGGRVDLARRGAMRRMLAALVAARRERPGVGLTVDELFAAGWPGESAQPEAAAGRVYTAVRELRGLGLEPVLRRHAEGYLLDPHVELHVTS